MSLLSFTAGVDAMPPTRASRNQVTRSWFYRAIAAITIFTMLFGGMSVAPRQAAAASAIATDRVNLRTGPGLGYDVLTVIPNGAAVTVDGDPEAGFYPVTYIGISGFSSVDYIQIGGSPSPNPDSGSVPVGDTATGTASVTSALYLRSGPATTYVIRATMPAGATVELRGSSQNGFYPLAYNGTTGWAHGNWLNMGGGTQPTPTPTPGSSNSVPVGDTVTGSATVTASLNLRMGPSTSYGAVTVMQSGSTVELRGSAQNSYYPLSYNGTTGWAHGNWLNIGGGSPSTPTPSPSPTPSPGSGNTVPVGNTATGSATVTSALNLRGGPATTYSITTTMPAGALVELRGAPQSGFYPLSYNGTTGWAHGNWLNIGGSSSPSPSPGGSHPPYLYTEEVSVQMRSQPTASSGIVWTIPPKTRVTVTGPMQNGWWPTKWAHVSGFMNGAFLVESLTLTYPPSKQGIVDIIYAAADQYGQPREDMLRVAICESALDPNAVNSSSGVSGLFQFRLSTWATTPFASQSVFDPTANAKAAAWMWSVGRRNEWACQ